MYFKGDDWKGTPRGLALERAFAEVGVDVVYFPYTVTTSSTGLRRSLALLEELARPMELAGPMRETAEGDR